MASTFVKESAGGKVGTRLRESNVKNWNRQQEMVTEAMRKQISESIGIDILEDGDDAVKDLFDITSPSFSLKKFVHACENYAAKRTRAREATGGASVVQQLLRAGIQMAVNSEYQAIETSYEELVHQVTSTKKVELYAPLYRAGYMGEVASGDDPPRLNISGADFQIMNKKFMGVIEIDRDDIEDDQTSQLTEQPHQIGENAKILKDSRVFVRWIGTAGQDASGEAVPASQTGSQAGETTWPFNAKFSKGGGANILNDGAGNPTPMAASYQAIILLRQLGRKMLDPKGNKMLVRYDTLWCGSALEDGFDLMLQSDSYPSTGSIHQATAGGADMGMGRTQAKNILKGKYNLVSSIWLPDLAYGLAQAAKGFTLQQRRPLEVVQENVLSGSAFLNQVYRWNINERYECDWREPRFAAAGSLGTV